MPSLDEMSLFSPASKVPLRILRSFIIASGTSGSPPDCGIPDFKAQRSLEHFAGCGSRADLEYIRTGTTDSRDFMGASVAWPRSNEPFGLFFALIGYYHCGKGQYWRYQKRPYSDRNLVLIHQY